MDLIHSGPSDQQDRQPQFDIEHPHNCDVLCGRGVSTNRHPGNESFRSLVGLNKELYVTSTKRQKMSISRSIVEAVRSLTPAGRFLEKHIVTNLWSDIGDRKAIEKTSQALRDGAATLRKQLSQDLGDPDFLSAVFDMESSSTSIKEKSKPTKKKQAKKGPAHRRTRSNPDAASLAKKKSLFRKIKSSDISGSPRASVTTGRGGRLSTPMSPPRSQPASPGSRRFIRREAPDRTHSLSSLPPNTPSSPSTPPVPAPGHFRFSDARSMSVMSNGSFESQHSHFDRHRPPPPMHWQYNPHNPHNPHGYGSGHPPLSPPPSHMSPNRPVYMRHPMSPGGYSGEHPRNLDYGSRPPMSPGMNRSWSPHSFTAGQHVSPRYFPGKDFSGWRSPMSVSSSCGGDNAGYPHGELGVPVLNRESPMPMSPLSSNTQYPSSASSNMYYPSSPMDFVPPPSPQRQPFVEKTTTAKKSCGSPSSMSTIPSLVKSKGSASSMICLSPQAAGSESPNVVVCGVVDESRSDNMLKPEVEIILSSDTDERFERDMALDYTSEDHVLDLNPAEVSNDSESMSPLPFDRGDDMCSFMNPYSLMQISEDILQMPIAPCGPQDPDPSR